VTETLTDRLEYVTCIETLAVAAALLRPPPEQVSDVLRSLPGAPDMATRVLEGLFKLGEQRASAQRAVAAAAIGE
jgi:hypothetical protein